MDRSSGPDFAVSVTGSTFVDMFSLVETDSGSCRGPESVLWQTLGWTDAEVLFLESGDFEEPEDPLLERPVSSSSECTTW